MKLLLSCLILASKVRSSSSLSQEQQEEHDKYCETLCPVRPVIENGRFQNGDYEGGDYGGVYKPNKAFQTVVKSCMIDNSTCPGGSNVSMNCWNTSGITDMQGAFFGSAFYADFNEPLDCWDTSNVKDMSYMFYFADKFNQDINSWNVSQVTRMRSMFYETESLDQNFEDWNVDNVRHMGWMFDLTKKGAKCPSWAYVGGTLPEGEGVTTGVSAVDDSYVRGNCEHPPAPAPCGVESMSSGTIKTETEISLVSVAALIIVVFV